MYDLDDRADNLVEENIARLLQAAYGEGVTLDSALKERTRRRLVQGQRFRRSAPAFPDRAVAALGLALASTAIWLALRVTGAGVAEVWRLPGLMIAFPFGANLALIPAAAVVVLRGRRRNER